ncbi:hypothetical protein [Butyrivibrio sp. NC2007]|uniref:hypothetical protein n=1 Tax=Butyrivibrio sp. NC2007 TaxID=1280683 RepID=UPI0003B49B0F|nr:hypothetical protein [Butyrivibrio sp. NC2007]
MDKLFEVANRYIKNSDWKTISVLKFCLISLGVMLGMLVKPNDKKKVYGIAGATFLLTYIPLMTKFFKIYQNGENEV